MTLRPVSRSPSSDPDWWTSIFSVACTLPSRCPRRVSKRAFTRVRTDDQGILRKREGAFDLAVDVDISVTARRALDPDVGDRAGNRPNHASSIAGFHLWPGVSEKTAPESPVEPFSARWWTLTTSSFAPRERFRGSFQRSPQRGFGVGVRERGGFRRQPEPPPAVPTISRRSSSLMGPSVGGGARNGAVRGGWCALARPALPPLRAGTARGPPRSGQYSAGGAGGGPGREKPPLAGPDQSRIDPAGRAGKSRFPPCIRPRYRL